MDETLAQPLERKFCSAKEGQRVGWVGGGLFDELDIMLTYSTARLSVIAFLRNGATRALR